MAKLTDVIVSPLACMRAGVVQIGVALQSDRQLSRNPSATEKAVIGHCVDGFPKQLP